MERTPSPSSASGPISEPRRIAVVESRWTQIEASGDEQRLLRELGVLLARNRESERDRDSDDEAAEDGQRSVVHVQRLSAGRCKVRVVDAVGVIATESLVLDVSPKIPSRHLLYLLERAGLVPRLAATRATLSADETLLDLIGRWYVRALDRVLKEGLARDYRTSVGELPVARGRVLALPTARTYYRGQLGVVSEYQDFDFDTPLNRLLLCAARLLARHRAASEDVRGRARCATLHMDGIGALQESDRRARPDRYTIYYSDAVLLAKHIIDGVGRGLVVGGQTVWTFLLRTPEPLEDGLRRTLVDLLPSELAPVKRRLELPGTNMTLNPDLIFGETAVAEVKYKLSQRSWRRPDLNQLVTFAKGFRTDHCAMIDFQTSPGTTLPSVRIGDIDVTHLSWPALEELTPASALEQLTHQIVEWARSWRP